MSKSTSAPPPEEDCSCFGVPQLLESWILACKVFSGVMQDNSTNPQAKSIILDKVLSGCGSDLISCMNNMCGKPEFTLKCEKCKETVFPNGTKGRPCGTISDCINRSSNEIIVCTQGYKQDQYSDCKKWNKMVLIFHEAVHGCICKEPSGSKTIECNETCAHLFTALVFSDDYEFYFFDQYKKSCPNAIFD